MSLFDLGEEENSDMRRQLLEGCPVVNPDAWEKSTDGEETTVVVKVKSGGGFLSRFRPPEVEKPYELDVFGTFVFRQIDEKRTVRDIINLFRERFGLSRRESEMGVVAFLKMLQQRQVITVVAASGAQEEA